MKKITSAQYVEGVNSIYVEMPDYELGHDGSDGKCDCIGMGRGALEREGVKDVTNMRGTNQAARKTIQNLQKIKKEDQLRFGDVVLKERDKDDPDMPLPDKYRKGGSEYDEKLGETNFTHFGSVTRVNPLEITHMTSPKPQKDTKLGKWSWFGQLPWVDESAEEEDDPGTVWAKVVAESGSTVKMRAKPSTLCRLYWDVPVGSDVIMTEYGEKWSAIIWAGRSGYMMTKFLRIDSGDMYTVIIPNLTEEQAEELCKAWENAIMQKE